MNIGSTAGFPGVNTDTNEWCSEATESFSPPIVEKNLLVRNLLLLLSVSYTHLTLPTKRIV